MRSDADETAIREFVREWRPRLTRVAYLLTGDHDAALDLMQDALVRVVANWSRVGASDRPEAYVRQILYHEYASWWRRGRLRNVLMSEVPEGTTGADDEEHVLRRLVLRRALLRLTPRQRAVLVLRFYEDLPVADVAETLRCSVNTVKSQIRHALGRLRVLAPELTVEFGSDLETAEVSQ
jgi:RNA polymerase sigma-70 factor (sigma-E family)